MGSRIFVNAANATGTGPAVLLARLIPELGHSAPDTTFDVALPWTPAFERLDLPDNMRAQWWPSARGLRNDALRARQLAWDLPRTLARGRYDACLTLGDKGPVRTPCPHVVFLHLALFAYGPEELAGLDAWSPLKRRWLETHFHRMARRAACIIVQTPVMAERVRRRYGLPEHKVATALQPPPHRPETARDGSRHARIESCGKPIRLLFLAAAYPHKNHRILPAMCAELRRRALHERVHIFTTVTEGIAETVGMLGMIRRESDLVTNLGRLSHDEIHAAWRSCSALFLPTLVESYGLPYLEALAFQKAILTSDRDFARWMCGEMGRYFDPLDPSSIVQEISRYSVGDDGDVGDVGDGRLARFPADWRVTADRFMEIVEHAMAAPTASLTPPAPVPRPLTKSSSPDPAPLGTDERGRGPGTGRETDVSICMVALNCWHVIEECLRSIRRTAGAIRYEVLLVDNASTDGTPEKVESAFPEVRVLRNASNVGFSRATNQGIEASGGRCILWLNTDTILHDGALATLLGFLDAHPRAGVVGPKVLNGDGSFQPQCRRGMPTPGASLAYMAGLQRLWPDNPKLGQYLLSHLPVDERNRVAAVSGCCLLARREVWQQIGPIDEDIFGFGEDIDWCVRAEHAGWEVWYEPAAVITHLKGQGGVHVRPYHKIRGIHQAMWVFYRKHLRSQYSPLVTAVVRTGVLASFATAMTATWLRHRTRDVARGLRALVSSLP